MRCTTNAACAATYAQFSTLEYDEVRTRIRLLDSIKGGQYKLLYVAPERVRSCRLSSRRWLERWGVARLLAVDEAHCISEWGHDFRPDYARIGQARKALGMPPCIALTATATDLVRRDIADQLDLREPKQFVTGFDRPNLSYHVVEARKDHDKLMALADAFARAPGPAIVYASSRARCEAVGQFLRHELRRPSAVYHAGLTREERTAAQESFMDGDVEIVVATNAFGMGVDKANVRTVVHFTCPAPWKPTTRRRAAPAATATPRAASCCTRPAIVGSRKCSSRTNTPRRGRLPRL